MKRRQTQKTQHEMVVKMAGMALLIALIVVMQYISGIIPPVAGFPITLVLIPIVLGAAMFGPLAGAVLGLAFGIMVYINCITGQDPGGHMVFEANPWLCAIVVLAKGAIAGYCSGLVYKLLKKTNGYLAMLMAAIVCPVVNTGVFLICMFVFYIDVLAAWAAGGSIIGYVLSGLLLINFLPELIINVVFSPAGQRILKSIKRR